jgi:membrane protein DedA with SNARE-associated domain
VQLAQISSTALDLQPRFVTQPLLEYLQSSPLGLWVLLGVLLLCGLGLPIPEDIILVTAGMVAAEDGQSWVSATALMYAGVLIGDSFIFLLGRRWGSELLKHRWILRMLSPEKQEKVAQLFHRYGSAVFFVARFLPGLRAPVFWTAGAMRASYVRFVLFDGVAALISVPVFVWLGHFLWLRFGSNFSTLSKAISRTHSYTLWFAVAVLIIATVGGTMLYRRLHHKDDKTS